MYRIPLKPLRSNLFGLDDAAAAALGSAVISGGVTMYNNHKQRKEQRALMDKSIESNIQQWNRENQYNTPQAQMKRFKDAGLNPNLIYGQSNTASSMIPSTDVPEAKMPSNSFSQGVSTFNNTRLLDAQIENIEADTDKKKVEAGNSTEMVNIQRELAEDTKKKTDAYINDLLDKKNLRGARAELYRMTVNKFEQDIRESVSRVMLNLKDYQHYDERFNATMREINARADEYFAKAGLEKQETENLRREYFEMIKTFEDRSNEIKSRVNLNNATAAEKQAVCEKLIMEAVSLGGAAFANLETYSQVQHNLQQGKYDSLQEKYFSILTSAFTCVIRDVFGVGISVHN